MALRAAVLGPPTDVRHVSSETSPRRPPVGAAAVAAPVVGGGGRPGGEVLHEALVRAPGSAVPPAGAGLLVWQHVVGDVSCLPGAVDVDPRVTSRWEVHLPDGARARFVWGLLQQVLPAPA